MKQYDPHQLVPTQETIKPAESDVVPESHETQPTGFPIVGIGASAGGLAAFEAFFSGMPADTDPGMAFVLVQHLAPDHKSLLTELVRRYTRMDVFEVVDGIEVKPNCTYIIPPNYDMAFLNGTLQLMAPSSPRGQRLPIDFFFRSLALDQRERAIGIVLSGTGSDGTLGVRAIKAEGGMVIAQSPVSAEYDDMPRNAIATGLVDYELTPVQMPGILIAYATHAFPTIPKIQDVLEPGLQSENFLKKIFVLLRSKTGHDFSQYKVSSINRRIQRRMAINQIELIENYVIYMQHNPMEIDALFRDLLIGVTNFFRDPEAFAILETEIIPKLFAGKPAGSVIRIWSAGCSTGEEAYSLAILLQEQLDALKMSYRVQVFATDIDSKSIDIARAGIYPASIAEFVSPERLLRFFSPEQTLLDGSPGFYRVHKNVRDLLVFSEQDLIRDPPFSKLDLISCRNLFIYMNGDLQKQLIANFHFALNSGGVLFLGPSESLGEFEAYFETIDHKMKLYRRKDDFQGMLRIVPNHFHLHLAKMDSCKYQNMDTTFLRTKQPMRELAEKTLLSQVAPAGALVDKKGTIFYLHGRTGKYLEPMPGEPGINNLMKMAREGLQNPLKVALRTASTTKETVRSPGLLVKTGNDNTIVNLTVCPASPDFALNSDVSLFMVIFTDAPEDQPHRPISLERGESAPETDLRIISLLKELQLKEEYLQSSNEELETFNEELKSTNEEMQLINEELQSTNEELETSKEELQSVNEELATVNTELQTKVADLSHLNNDMNNILAGTGIGMIFVDHQLRILRFTPTVTRMINLITTDIGRPVRHIASNIIGYDSLVQDVQSVLDTLVPMEMEVQILGGKWYMMRILPYRTIENIIEGAVITFSDITTMKLMTLEMMTALRDCEKRYQNLLTVGQTGKKGDAS